YPTVRRGAAAYSRQRPGPPCRAHDSADRGRSRAVTARPQRQRRRCGWCDLSVLRARVGLREWPGTRVCGRNLALNPPIAPMLAKLADELPPAGGFLYEPKWDGFRAIVFRGEDDVYIQSRDSRPRDRYFPDLHAALLERLPKNCVVDGEIVIVTEHGLDFDALQLRLHPAESRVAKLAKATPSAFVAFDVLVVGE